jgi:hypothetical protein
MGPVGVLYGDSMPPGRGIGNSAVGSRVACARNFGPQLAVRTGSLAGEVDEPSNTTHNSPIVRVMHWFLLILARCTGSLLWFMRVVGD